MAEDSEWIVESIAGYLGSPDWVMPVSEFIEHNCSVFDDEEENKLSYTEIHQQYKEMVETLLDNYMKEVGISEEQFLQACSSPLVRSKTLQNMIQPVMAADDFDIFKSLMIQKNIELQLQALRVIQERNGSLPDCLTDGLDMMSELEQQELRILKEVLKRSKEEYDQELAKKNCYGEEAGSASNSSKDRMRPASVCQQGVNLKKQLDKETQPIQKINSSLKPVDKGLAVCTSKTKETEKSNPSNDTVPSGRSKCSNNKVLAPVRVPVKGSEPFPEPKEKSSLEAAEAWLEEARKEAGISRPLTDLTASQMEQLQQRAEYLKQQRDRLLAMKKDQKPKETTESLPLTETKQEMSEEERKKIEKRKHLAEKLKQEVIKK